MENRSMILRRVTDRLKTVSVGEAFGYIQRVHKKRKFADCTIEELKDFLKVSESGKIVEPPPPPKNKFEAGAAAWAKKYGL